APTNEIAKNGNGNFIAVDVNNDGEIQISEAEQVVILNVEMDSVQVHNTVTGEVNFPYYFSHLPDNISDALLFTNVEELYISDTKNANISFLNNTKIKKLMCMNRWFYNEGSYNGNVYEGDFYPVDFTIDNCPSILTMNDISAYYHPGFEGETIFRIKNNPQFNGALVLNNRLISELYFENINLTSININDCRGLAKLSVPNIATLQTINITNTEDSHAGLDQEINLVANNCTTLQEIILDGDYSDNHAVYLSAINVNGCTSLKKIKGLNAPNIDFSAAGLVNLEELNCAFHNRYDYTGSSIGTVTLGKVNTLNLTGLPKLKKLLAYNQPINNINFTVCPLLEEIDIVNSACFMTDINVSNLVNLHTLKAYRGADDGNVAGSLPANLQHINAQNCTSLINLNIKINDNLQSLNLQNCSSLQSLIMGLNPIMNYFPNLTNLNIQQCTSLEELIVSRTKVNALNTAGCSSLKLLDLTENEFLSQLNTSGSPALEDLILVNTPSLASLNTTNNINLKKILVTQSPFINQLDFSNNAILETVSLENMANLTSVNINNGSIEQNVGFQNYNSNLAVCVDDAQLTALQAQYPSINFSSNCSSLFTTTWDGSNWSNGSPNGKDVIIAGTYGTSVATPAFTARNITIKNNGVLEITSGNTITALNVIIEDGGNLIQKDVSALSYTGTFKVLKNGSSAQNKYAFWSSPVAAQDLTSIYGTGNTPQFITEYNTATDYFVNATSTTSIIGKGYSVKTPSVSNVAFEGTPNNGTQTFTLNTAGNGFNLVGNPYPSNLNLNTFYNSNSARISHTFYFWDNTSNSVTTQGGATTTNIGYATYNPLVSAWVPAPNISSVPAGVIANIGQGFIVKTLNTSVDPSLTFNNDMRTETGGSFFNKNNTAGEGKFWLRLNSSYNTSNTIAIAYLNGASDSFDNYDSKAIAIGSDAFYTVADAQKLVIQGKASFDVDDIVRVGAKHFENGNFTISLVQKEGVFNNGQPIYLHDRTTGTYTNLQNGMYSFTANAGEFTDRFEIVYKLNVLSTVETEKGTFEVYKNGEDFFVRNDKNIEKVEIFDAAGRKVKIVEGNSKSVRISLGQNGVYILKATSAGKKYTKKIIK
ncbi:T9SS type A sorting domain-containing protein, partial [Chryseobacterium sp. 2TAF14]|uniref:T9SS type A sorting domain-containing protein n=1 Tax=Chryseobacterium sp. 2TAF14 TaxID=3233007 RepID=UPI003F8E27F7